MSKKLDAGARFPKLDWPAVGGGRLDLAAAGGWRLLVVYRGAHCPLCKRYLATLGELSAAFAAAGVSVAAVSADPRAKAEADVDVHGWRFPVGYDLSPDQMRDLGLYVSHPRSPQETDRPFSEPGLFALRPDDRLQIIDVSNAPFARPDLAALLDGLKFVIEKDYPIRGTA